MNVLVLFKRDLGLAGHAPLQHAIAQGGCVLPLHVIDPRDWGPGRGAARQWAFVAEQLEDLRERMARLGAPLVVRQGETEAVLTRLCRMFDIGMVVTHSTPWDPAHERRLKAWADGAGIALVSLAPLGADHADAFRMPAGMRAVSGVEPGLIPQSKGLGLGLDDAPNRQRVGRAAAEAMLDSFRAGRGARHPCASLSPLAGERAGLRLSPWLSWGTLSLAEVRLACSGAEATLGQPVLRHLRARLDQHARRLRADLPDLAGCHAPSGPRPRDLCGAAPAMSPDQAISALRHGRTGLPFIDALLRSAGASGWLNMPARRLVASVGMHRLGLDAGVMDRVMADLMIDHHPAICPVLLQPLAEAAPLDPLRPGEEHDPEGLFIRRWLPELAQVPTACLHRPWRWSGAGRVLGRRYPEPPPEPLRPARKRRRSAVMAQPLSPLDRRMRLARDGAVVAGAGQLALDLPPAPSACG